jgi:NAD(P)-dependent dehydrogenase (short-subunit alcohol dehydrogenase family)
MNGDGVSGRVVIITGGAGGIGRGLCRHLGEHGATVVLTGRDQAKIEGALEELHNLEIEAVGLQCDVRDRAAMFAMVDDIVQRFGRIDAIVNNAQAFGKPAPMTELQEEELDLIVDSGVKGTLWGMLAVYPHMKKAGWGRIVNVASSTGRTGAAGFAAYNVAKEGIRALTRTAGTEWARDGIVVNCFCPAAVVPRARDHEGVILNEYQRRAHELFPLIHPTGHWGDPTDDIGPVVAFLCSDGCRYMTGETLMLDGGSHMFS